MATWPSTLPAPQRAGYQISVVDPSLRTEMEVGAARSRRQTHARNDRVRVGWMLTDAQMDIFRTWFESDAEAAGGSAWFTVSLRIGNTGATTQEARFIGAYQFNQAGFDTWSVSAELEVRDV
jgi:hypothetical protein